MTSVNFYTVVADNLAPKIHCMATFSRLIGNATDANKHIGTYQGKGYRQQANVVVFQASISLFRNEAKHWCLPSQLDPQDTP